MFRRRERLWLKTIGRVFRPRHIDANDGRQLFEDQHQFLRISNDLKSIILIAQNTAPTAVITNALHPSDKYKLFAGTRLCIYTGIII